MKGELLDASVRIIHRRFRPSNRAIIDQKHETASRFRKRIRASNLDEVALRQTYPAVQIYDNVAIVEFEVVRPGGRGDFLTRHQSRGGIRTLPRHWLVT